MHGMISWPPKQQIEITSHVHHNASCFSFFLCQKDNIGAVGHAHVRGAEKTIQVHCRLNWAPGNEQNGKN